MLSQAHRRSIHTSLTPILGEEETDALMSQLPASESDMPATKSDLTLLRSDVQQQLVDFRAEFRTELADFRTEVHDMFRRMAMQMLVVIVSALIGGMALSAAIAAGVARAVGGG